MGRVIIAGGKPAMEAPSRGLVLSALAEGSIVKINENGSPAEFYVAKHNYESGLNGTGRTLLVRKDCYDNRQWHTSDANAYASSAIDSWLNGGYKSVLDADVRSAIGTVEFYYTPGNGNNTVTTLTRAVFLLSMTELATTESWVNTEGSALPIASILKIAYNNGSTVSQWTRSPTARGSNDTANYVYSNGTGAYDYVTEDYCWSRPCFTLPASAVFDETTLEFKGVA